MAQAAAARIKAPSIPQSQIYLARVAVAAFFALLMIAVRPLQIGGDTYWYVLDIRASMQTGWAEPRLWEFAHLLWRPLGRLLAQLFLPVVNPVFGGDPQVSITFLLMCVNLVAGLACGLLLHQAVWKLSGRPWLSTLAAVAFFGLGPALTYSRAGTPYLPGLALSTAAIYLAGFQPVFSLRRGIICGLLAAAAAMFWAPYLFSIPAVLLVSPILNRFHETAAERIRFAVVVCLAAGLLLAAGYAVAIAFRHITSIAGFRSWMNAEQIYSRTRTLIRLPGGVARGFYYLGDDNVWFKWYLFHDPYAQVGIPDLLRFVALKLALFYGALLALIVLLRRSSMGKRLLLLAALLAIPHIMLALTYESGDPSRYVPLLACLMLPFGFAVAGKELGRGARASLLALSLAPLAVNVAVAGSAGSGGELREAVAANAATSSTFFVLNGRDGIFQWRYPSIFRSAIPQSPSIALLDTSSTLNARWQSEFACASLAHWDRGEEVWVTERVMAESPKRDWLWVEGDMAGINWAALHSYFAPVEHATDRGASDGFFRIDPTDRNRALLTDALPGGRQVCVR